MLNGPFCLHTMDLATDENLEGLLLQLLALDSQQARRLYDPPTNCIGDFPYTLRLGSAPTLPYQCRTH